MGRTKGLTAISWTDRMTELLIAEADKPENAIVLRGSGQSTSSTTKKAVFERIASVVLPELYARNRVEAGRKVHSKHTILCKTYAEKLRLLRATGSGIGNGDGEDRAAGGAHTGLQQVHLKYYIGSNGPTEDTPPEGLNLWESIIRDFKWFPEMHRMLSSRPNQNPIAVTTGIGPTGPQTVLNQPPSREGSPDWNTRLSPDNFPNNNSDSSSIYIFPPSSPPPPPGPGKAVDPREYGTWPALTDVNAVCASWIEKTQLATGKSVANAQASTKIGKPGPKAAATVKDKKVGPRPSKHTAELQKTQANGSNNRKRKDRDPFMSFAEDFASHRAKVNADNTYTAEKRLLLTAASKYNYSKKEFKRRDRRIDIRYGRIDGDDSDSSDGDVLPMYTPFTEPMPSTSYAPVSYPSPELLVIDSSPIPTPQPHPFNRENMAENLS